MDDNIQPISAVAKKGVWDRVLAALQTKKSEENQLDWEIHLIDGSVVRAHQHAAGAKKAPPKKKLWGEVEVD